MRVASAVRQVLSRPQHIQLLACTKSILYVAVVAVVGFV